MKSSSFKECLIIIIPYIVGLLWVLSHPLVSVITGELKCRGIYIDEHQLDPNAYDTITAHNAKAKTGSNNAKRKQRNVGSNDNRNANANANANGGINVMLDEILKGNGNGNGNGNDEEYYNMNMCSILKAITSYSAINTNTTSTTTQTATGIDAGNQLKNLARTLSSPSISCHSHYEYPSNSSSSSFQVVKIDPPMASTTPLEALVIVIPSSESKSESKSKSKSGPSSTLQKLTLSMMERMAQHSFLAKSLLFVISNDASNDGHGGLDKTVNDFFTLYNMKQPLSSRTLSAIKPSSSSSSSSSSVSPATAAALPLPIEYTKYLIRQLIVLDIEATPTIDAQSSFFRIIPHGANGLLPNLDLLTAALYSFENAGIKRAMGKDANNNDKRYSSNDATDAMHSFHDFSLWWESSIIKGYYFPRIRWLQEYGNNLGHLGAFMISAIFR